MRPRLLWPMPTSNRAFPIERIDRLLGHRDHSPVLHGVVGIAAHLVSSRQEDASLVLQRYFARITCGDRQTRGQASPQTERSHACFRVASAA